MEGVKGYGVRSGLTPKASLWRRRAARRGRPGSGCPGRSAQAAAWWRWSEGPGSLLPVPPSLWLQTGRAGTAGRWRPQELTPLWASLPPPPCFGGKAAEQPLIGPAGGRGAGGGEDRRVCLFSILVSTLTKGTRLKQDLKEASLFKKRFCRTQVMRTNSKLSELVAHKCC